MATVSARTDREGTVADRGTDQFGGALRWEIFSEEGRALLWSYMISFGLGIVWLLLVIFGPRTRAFDLRPKDEVPIAVTIDSEVPEPTPEPAPQTGEAERVASPGPVTKAPGPEGPEKGDPKPGRPGSKTESNKSGAIGDAFGTGSGAGTGGMVGDVSGILSNVTSSGSGGSGGGLGGVGGGGSGGKAVLGNGQGGQGSVRPGRGGIGGGSGTGGGGGGGIGGVGPGGGMTRGTVRVSAPSVVSAPDLGGPGRDVGELGAFVRSRENILRYCYTEQGLKVNPNLAGSIRVSITLTGSGSVTGVDAVPGTMSGAGTSEVTSCIEGKIRSWKFPASEQGGGTYSFPFSFTKGASGKGVVRDERGAGGLLVPRFVYASAMSSVPLSA
jgi:hypothetical protein